ncbi:8-oxo-dGTP pyrophosphatase MutT (NUDIX family) [Mucilaginibacter yixingensis]|uniref:8-oxo-dGTP pyrophosphatase MutT (NUDIX family) n=1 Tax=Mucilaginibacter yixingensis TaxID=1295612 RepID=A0A2T5JAN6_9SPHI|nr:8-oxo-dGTP pyrophosphatase MutT (NUDIX family) [Mucilaginibacter yixingensis]
MITETIPDRAEIFQKLDSEGFDLKTFYAKISKRSKHKHFYILCDDAKKYLKKVIASITLIKAAGGLVKNEQGDFLFIYRNDKWDLPKGKLEKGEGAREGAVREVEEECGISISKCGKRIVNTYHAYTIKGEVVLKKTYWYKMKYKGVGRLKPQIEEGITEVRWFNKQHMDAIKTNTFPSIMDVLEKMELIKDTVMPL